MSKTRILKQQRVSDVAISQLIDGTVSLTQSSKNPIFIEKTNIKLLMAHLILLDI